MNTALRGTIKMHTRRLRGDHSRKNLLSVRPTLRYRNDVQDTPNTRDARRRWFGAFYLAVAAGMVIWGQTLLEPHLRGWGFILYWLACALFTLLAIGTATFDLFVLRRRARREQRELFEKAFDIEHDSPDGTRQNEKNSQR